MNSFDSHYGARYGMRPACACQNEARMARPDAFDAQSLAMAYVPIQAFQDLYDLPKALQHGTIFQELDFPFYGGSFRCENGRR